MITAIQILANGFINLAMAKLTIYTPNIVLKNQVSAFGIFKNRKSMYGILPDEKRPTHNPVRK